MGGLVLLVLVNDDHVSGFACFFAFHFYLSKFGLGIDGVVVMVEHIAAFGKV
jgi:hypothetical protein